ncbi:hypothetical protein HNQ94_001192 [Salirhabdus euzebyi]|uniref:Uncharacterized protein n=1 Tax=Salirhabdus euzebyi TaxID=394506 RepID=A0A841PYJ1_9BACI|nr:hypothetical protein [Salirhabdus euzebyi]
MFQPGFAGADSQQVKEQNAQAQNQFGSGLIQF